MNKIFGKKGDFAVLKEDGTRMVVAYGYEDVDVDYATWIEVYLPYKQHQQLTIETVEEAVINDINARTQERIISGMVWEDKPVWLSIENQLNFSTAQAPVTLKIGELEDGTPVKHTFETAKEVTAFWKACATYRQQCLADGQAEKEGMDWSEYEKMFKAINELNA